MMRYFLAIAGILFGFAAAAQNEEVNLKKEADRYYNEEQYNLAVQYYRELSNLSDQDAEVNYQLAESYRKIFNYTEAEVYYLKAFYQAPAQFPLSLYYYALMLKLNGSFDESIKYFSEFIATASVGKDLKEFSDQAVVDRAGSEMAKTETAKNNSTYHLSAENFNSAYNDYAPALRDSNTMVITSGRVGSNRDVIDERYGEAFTDNFYFSKSGSGWQDRTRQVFSITNTRFNDGSGCFNTQGTKYYYTVCGKDVEQCRIFLTVYRDNKWSEPVALNENVNVKNFESRHPAVSPGGDTLLFSSNRKGGFGNYDIWMSINSGNEVWGPAMNLGSTINTKLNEVSPAFAGLSHIFFLASDGHQNYGGLDLYMAKRFSNNTVALYNLDYPFNSNRDDCFVTFAEHKLYFSSNREGGKGGFDIYSVPIPSVISFVSKISRKNRVSRSDVKLNTRAEKSNQLNLITARNEDRIEYENLTYEKKKIVDKMVANQLNNASNNAEDFQGLSKSDYQELLRISQTQAKTQEIENRFKQSILAHLKTPAGATGEMLITGVVKDSVSGKVVTDLKILLMNEMGEVLKVTSTNNSGNFRFTNIPSGDHFYLRFENGSEALLSKIKVTDLKFKASEQNTFSFENIYFDFDHYTLRPEAKQVLNELAEFLKSNSSEQVELYAYADDRGADEYNMELTRKRGQVVLRYLIEKGVDQTAMAVIAKGRQKNPSTQVEIQRQFNRRVEFSLNGEKINSGRPVKTYILKKKTDWVTLAKMTGVSVSELKKLNGVMSDELKIFEPIRLPDSAKVISDILFFKIR